MVHVHIKQRKSISLSSSSSSSHYDISDDASAAMLLDALQRAHDIDACSSSRVQLEVTQRLDAFLGEKHSGFCLIAVFVSQGIELLQRVAA